MSKASVVIKRRAYTIVPANRVFKMMEKICQFQKWCNYWAV